MNYKISNREEKTTRIIFDWNADSLYQLVFLGVAYKLVTLNATNEDGENTNIPNADLIA